LSGTTQNYNGYNTNQGSNGYNSNQGASTSSGFLSGLSSLASKFTGATGSRQQNPQEYNNYQQ
jgi:hypothetical protein